MPANTLKKTKHRGLILQLIELLALTFANRRYEIQSTLTTNRLSDYTIFVHKSVKQEQKFVHFCVGY